MQEAAYQQKFDTGKHRVVMVKNPDVHFDGKIAVFRSKPTGCLSPSVRSTSYALAFFIYKEEWRCITFLEVYPCICIWWKAWFRLCHLLLTSIASPCRNIKGGFKHFHAVLMKLCWPRITYTLQMSTSSTGLLGRCSGMLPTTALLVLSQTCRCLSLQLNCTMRGNFPTASSKECCST